MSALLLIKNMNKKLLLLVTVIAILLVILIIMGIFSFLNKPKVIETKTFSAIPGFSFEYPEFKGWESSEPKITKNDEVKEVAAIIGLNTPTNILFGVSPQIKIVKSGYAYKGPNNTTIEDNPNLKINGNGARYYMILQYSNPEISEGLPFINFYASDSIITIYPFMREGDGYSGKAFVDKVIETFRFQVAKTPESIGYNLLTNISAFSEQYQDAIKAVADRLTAEGEKPDDYYATVIDEKVLQTPVIVISLLHRDDFKPENNGVSGNPSGKDREMYYNLDLKKITKEALTQ